MAEHRLRAESDPRSLVELRWSGHRNDETEDGERFVPLFASIRRLLLERKARQRYSGDEDFVFGSVIGTALDPGNFSRREWKPALRSAGLRHWRFHDLRHFAVSQLIAQGADIMLIANIAGHKDPVVTLRVYSHLMTPPP